MPNNSGTIEQALRGLAKALKPLGDSLDVDFFHTLGIGIPLAWQNQLRNSLQALQTAAQTLPSALQQLEQAMAGTDSVAIIARGVVVGEKIVSVALSANNLANTLQQLAQNDASLSNAQKTNIQQAVSSFFPRLLETAIVRLLETEVPQLAAALHFLGIAERNLVAGTPGDFTAPSFERRQLRLDRLMQVIQQPTQYTQELFDWGQPGFDGAMLLARLKKLFDTLHFPTHLIAPVGQPPILEVFLAGLQANTTFNPPALGFELRFPVNQAIKQSFPLSPPWSLEVNVEGIFAAGVSGVLQPPAAVLLQPPSGQLSFRAGSRLVAQQPNERTVIIGLPGGTRLDVERLALGVEMDVVWDSANGHAAAKPVLSFAFENGKLTIDLKGGDGFLASVIPVKALEADFSLKGELDLQGGLRFEGSGAIELALATHLSLGPLEIQTIYLVGRLGQPKPLALELSAGIKLELGPLTATVDQLGAIATFDFPADSRGNLGPVQFGLGFQPPKGVGLALDAGPVKGGGYLYFDVDKEEYAGALELTFSGFLSLKAIGLVTTRMPDGKKGFSLLIIITAEFGTPIQLGFGFTLIGVGGLLGLNRTMQIQLIAEGVRSGAINSIMFPKNVIANAPKIISDLRTFFPPRNDRFLVGPMAKLGWGTPTLVSLSLGVIIEIPPGNVVIVGVLRIALPADELQLIVLQVNFIGAFEPEKKRLWFFAELYDSRVLFITLTGGLGVLISFGDDANLVLSVGGFHPRFQPPALPFPVPQRLAINILNESYARIRVEGYFAVTTNTVQFGVKAEAFFGLDELNVSGHFQFDALFYFSPFHFDISISARFSVKVFGVGLFTVSVSFQLEGPTPWRARGTGSISILFFDIEVSFDITWGDKPDTILPPVEVMPILVNEFAKEICWRAEPPLGSNLLVTLRPLAANEAGKILHPLGMLYVSQKAVPLDLQFTKFGNQRASDVNRIHLDVEPTSGLTRVDDVFEQFAPAQFRDFDEAAKLSKAAFEKEHGGISLTGSSGLLATATMVKRSTRFELILIDQSYRQHQRFYRLTALMLAHWVKGGSAARCELSKSRRTELQPFSDLTTVSAESFAVARMDNNSAMTGTKLFSSYGQAEDYLRSQVRKNPELAGQFHVIPQFEVSP